MRQFLLPAVEHVRFYVLYANVNGVDRRATRRRPDDLDRWVLSRLHATAEVVRERLDDYDATRAGRAIAAFVDDLSNWYVRRSRRRFWDGDPAAFATLRTCLVTVAQAAGAVHAVHRRRDLRQPRRHRAERPPDRLPRAGRARRGARGAPWRSCARPCGWGSRRAGRPSSRCASRCARRSSSPPAREREAIERLADVVREELNVKELRFVSAADELGRYEVKPNYRALGPRFGKLMPQVADAVAALDPAHVAAALREGRAGRHLASTATTTRSAPTTCMLAMQPLDGYQLEREGSHAVALDLALDDELRREGLAREIVHAVQNARKSAGLAGGGPDRAGAGRGRGAARRARAYEDYVAGETLARSRRLRRPTASASSGDRSTGASCGSAAAAPARRGASAARPSAGSSSASRRFFGYRAR